MRGARILSLPHQKMTCNHPAKGPRINATLATAWSDPRPAAALLALLLALGGSLAPEPVLAQSVGGRVVDGRSQTPVPAAVVALVDAAADEVVVAEARTDAEGRFRLDGVPAGQYRLRVEAFGYRTVGDREIEIGRGAVAVRVVVEPAPLEGEGLTVQVERLDSRLRNKRQVISGKVLDATSGEAIEAMEVLARDVNGDLAGRSLSDQDGRFFFVVENAGLYHLAVSGFGYDSTATANVAVAPDQDLYLELEVQPVAFGLDPIKVTAPQRVPYLEGTGFYSRMRRGQGTYLTPRDLERVPSAFPTQLLRRIAGISVGHDGSITIRGITGFMGGPCRPNIVVDGMMLRDVSLDDVVPMTWIDAIEVYKGPATVPAQWRGAGVCGVIAVWTKH